MAFDMSGFKRLVYHNQASTDFGILLSYPWQPVHATRDVTATHVPGKNGDIIQDNGSFQNVTETFTGIVMRDPDRYSSWEELNTAVWDWLVAGDYSPLLFDGYPDYVFSAVAQPPTITADSVSELQGTISMPFNCEPTMKRIDGIDWQKCPIGTVTNTENLIARPDWHIVGTGNFYLRVSGLDYKFNEVEGDIYLDGATGNAYYYDSNGTLVSKNPDCEFTNLDSPELDIGPTTISYGNSDTENVDPDTSQTTQPSQPSQTTQATQATQPKVYPMPKVYWKPNWERVV